MNKIVERIEIQGEGDNLNLTVHGYEYSPTNILIHLERLSGLTVIAKKSWVLTDDFEAYFLYKEHAFVLYTPFSEVEITPGSEDAPIEITQEIFNHIKDYKTVWFHESILGWIRYLLLPFNYKD